MKNMTMSMKKQNNSWFECTHVIPGANLNKYVGKSISLQPDSDMNIYII